MAKAPLGIRLAQALDLIGDQGQAQNGDGLPQRNAPSPLSVFVPFIRKRGERRARRLTESPNKTSSSKFKAEAQLALPADNQWHNTGVQLNPGDSVTLAARGRLFLSKPLEVSVGAKTCLWWRIGDGEMRRCTQETHTLVADQQGELRLQAALPGAFGTPDGCTSIDPPPPAMLGELDIRISKTTAATQSTIKQKPPQGWQYLWRLGEADIFSTCEHEAGAICCDTHGDVGILQYPVDMPLDKHSLLRWEWLVDALPSSLPEHIQPTHDYLSIAVEFDNGLDLTYMWSSQLAPDTIFQCPLPYWDKRETHWVLRNPSSDPLGRWLVESRPIQSDYQQAIGGELPSRIVKIWLIANSAFQNGHGSCKYRGITVGNREQRFTL
ncbi:DUF3047 domain-containing protein [Spongiibacter sp. KMU-158]|uniref:DUF3047 domain-containing protein n=1 Tax=Spongiibacter pelagi TaxID=2760804 RepID=A0A927GXI0_9GAMM|nr:DUF3047 domain-containing protein [Spongiibacter pelagi]MBD2859444.1 DUF3047 domain-containing protein [Spongiibacter pelagi]